MPQLVSIQYLRAVAALMVVIYHARLHLDRLGLPAAGTDWLASGVDVFFVISGLIMWVSTAVQPVGTLAFWWRRVVRIVPLYWLLTTVLVAVSLLAPSLLRTARFDLAHTAASLLFLPWTHPVMGEPMPVLVPGWTLNYEMGFYLLFGLALALPARLRFWTVGGALLALVVAARMVAAPGLALRFYGADLVLEFWLGMALGRLLLAGRMPGAGTSLALLLLGVALLPLGWALSATMVPAPWPGLSRGLAVGPAAAMMVLGAMGLEAAGRVPLRRFPLRVGDASYGLYLCHVLVLAAVAEVWRRVWPGSASLGWSAGGLAATVLFVLAGAAVATIAALILYRFVETPLRRMMRARRTPVPQAA